MKRSFCTLDVFTEQKFAGNPLAVVFDADGMSDAAMQAIAREFNLSETVFVTNRPMRRVALICGFLRLRGNYRLRATRQWVPRSRLPYVMA